MVSYVWYRTLKNIFWHKAIQNQVDWSHFMAGINKLAVIVKRHHKHQPTEKTLKILSNFKSINRHRVVNK